MAIDGEELEGGMRLAQVRATKKYLIIAQAIISLLVVIGLVVTGGKFQLKPFYFDVGEFLYFLLIMVFLIAAELLVFRLLEVKYAKTDSAKYYMLKTTARHSIIVMVISAIVLLLVVTPYVLDSVTEVTSHDGTTSDADRFYSRDVLGLTTVDRITVNSDLPTEVIVISEENYLANKNDWKRMREVSEAYVPDASPGAVMEFTPVPFGAYYIVTSGDIAYNIHSGLSPFFVGFVTTFATLFIGAHATWLVYTMPLRKRYVRGAIFR